jgi:aminoglycoside phosphotransferase (APT) family kinase protein
MAVTKGVPLPGTVASALSRLQEVEQELTTDEPPCLCHNDLLASNFINNGSEMRIIDWEYGGLGDRFFDLGNFAVNQPPARSGRGDHAVDCVHGRGPARSRNSAH